MQMQWHSLTSRRKTPTTAFPAQPLHHNLSTTAQVEADFVSVYGSLKHVDLRLWTYASLESMSVKPVPEWRAVQLWCVDAALFAPT